MQADKFAGGDEFISAQHLMAGKQTLLICVADGADHRQPITFFGFTKIADARLYRVGGKVAPVLLAQTNAVQHVVQSLAERDQVKAVAEMLVVIAPGLGYEKVVIFHVRIIIQLRAVVTLFL